MRAVIVEKFGGPENLSIGEWPTPEPAPREVRVKVAATALNRADTLQREGKYPPPPGDSPILGLEMAGTVDRVGKEVKQWKEGDRVCGLLGGGGYAEYALIHEEMALPIPTGLDFPEAAAIPEVFLTAFQALRWLADIQNGERLLVHAGASGVGTAAIQLAREMGAEVFVTASRPKHDICLELGARHAIDYQSENFAAVVKGLTKEEGVDVIIDFIGAPYFKRNLEALRTDGRLVILAFLGGVQVKDMNIAALLRKRLRVEGSTLRSRSLDYKIALTGALNVFAWPRFGSGVLQPVVDTIFDWTDVAEAHRYMEANKNRGKIVLRIS